MHAPKSSGITSTQLKLNGGDIKSVQGDSGHAQMKMVADVYSHIIDEDRVLNAQRFEETFYHTKDDDKCSSSDSSSLSIKESTAEDGSVAGEHMQETTDKSESTSDEELLIRLLKNPEMATLLKALAKNL